MTAFVLVHGSGQNASCWSRVGRSLCSRGHDVVTPELPKRAPPGWGLSDYAALIARAVTESGTVVVAHSFSGAFLPLVPRTSDCARLVFLAAVVPEPGASVRDQLAVDPTMFGQAWLAAGAHWFDESQVAELAREFLFHDCDEATLAWALSTVELCDTRSMVTEPCPLVEWPSVACTSLVATEDRTLSPDWGRRITRRVLHADAIEVRAGHCPHVSQPEAIAELLDRLARDGG